MYSKAVLYFLNLMKSKVFSIELSKAIDVSAIYSEVLSFNSLNIYDLSDLESYLLLKVSDRMSIKKTDKPIINNTLFVVTEPYLTGGHTRLMENLSLMMPSESHLLITGNSEPEITLRLDGFFTSVDDCVRLSGESSIAYVERIACKLLAYELVVLNIHTNDIWTTLACGVAKKFNKKLKVHFVNHADHLASYGATIADVWYQISLYGIEIDKYRNIIGSRSFLGIPINKSDSDFFNDFNYPMVKSDSRFLTAASNVKYKPCNKKSIFSLLFNLLQKYPLSTVCAIGPNLLKDSWWWLLFLKYKSRVSITHSLPYDKYLEVTRKADFYIDSHPIPGGTAFVEQFLQGMPCIGLKSGFYGYTPLELMKSDSINEVINVLNNPPGKSEIRLLQQRIFDLHAFSSVKERFITSVYDDVVSVSPMIGYSDEIVTNIEVKGSFSVFSFLKKIVKFLLVIK